MNDLKINLELSIIAVVASSTKNAYFIVSMAFIGSSRVLMLQVTIIYNNVKIDKI